MGLLDRPFKSESMYFGVGKDGNFASALIFPREEVGDIGEKGLYYPKKVVVEDQRGVVTDNDITKPIFSDDLLIYRHFGTDVAVRERDEFVHRLEYQRASYDTRPVAGCFVKYSEKGDKPVLLNPETLCDDEILIDYQKRVINTLQWLVDNGEKFQGQTSGKFEVYAQAVYGFSQVVCDKASVIQIMNQRYRYPINKTVTENSQKINALRGEMLEKGLVPIPDRPITGQVRGENPAVIKQ